MPWRRARSRTVGRDRRSAWRLQKVQQAGRQIKFSLRLHGGRGPLLLFICKARLNYGWRKEVDESCGRVVPIVVLADRKHHCTTTAASGSLYLNVFRTLFQSLAPFRPTMYVLPRPRPPSPFVFQTEPEELAKFLWPPNNSKGFSSGSFRS